jgi:nitrogen regulatory protein P-II 1
MKLVLAIIPREHMQRVTDALVARHIHGLMISEARGFGQEHDVAHPEHHEYVGLETIRKIRLEIVCQDEEVEVALEAIYQVAHTGHRGDGKVFVIPVLDALRLKTGERGSAALGPQLGES